MSVVEYSEKLFSADGYDRAYCVFDRDDHANYEDAIRRIRQLEGFYAVPSCPCFEIWILLHFIYSSAPRDRNDALAQVLKHYATYTKGSKTVFQDLQSRLDDAIGRARRLEIEIRKSGATNPATRMHELVEYLIGLKG